MTDKLDSKTSASAKTAKAPHLQIVVLGLQVIKGTMDLFKSNKKRESK